MWKMAVVLGLTVAIASGEEETPAKRLRQAAEVLQEIMAAPDKGIPQDLLEQARCVIVVPGLKKGAFIVGADYGRGYVICRSGNSWGAPAAVRIGGGSFGAQLGLESTDLVMLVMNQKGMDRLAGNKFTIGADASAAIGPIGRTAKAATDATLTAELLAYSRSKGVFAGIALDGTTVTPDHAEDRKLYGRDVSTREILRGQVKAPEAANALIAVLKQYSSH
jgi:lipid-binding SYLF domain-containing protein